MIPRRMHTSRRMHRSRRVLCVRMRVEGISVRQRSRRVLGVRMGIDVRQRCRRVLGVRMGIDVRQRCRRVLGVRMGIDVRQRCRRVLGVRMGIDVRQRSRRVLGVDVLHVLNRGSVLGRRRVGRLELHARARCVFGVRGDVGRLRFESCLCRLHLRCMGRCVLLW